MKTTFYTVNQISVMLDIHPKTIQRYIREGKLLATKIGKSWRVSGHDLSLFTEGGLDGEIDTSLILKDHSASSPNDKAPPSHHKAIASSVVDIEVKNKQEAMRIMNTLTASMNAKPPELGKSSMQSQYIERENLVRVTLWGEVAFVAIILDTIQSLLS